MEISEKIQAVAIREYAPDRDREPLRRCFIELQDFERGFDPAMPAGGDVADAYIDWMLARCAAAAGKVFVAEVDGQVVGFSTVLARVRAEEPDEPQVEHAFLSELVVLASHRGKKIGEALIRKAEEHARREGARTLKTLALAGNRAARLLYRKAGFSERMIELSKPL